VVFKHLGDAELRQILDIELRAVQQRVLAATGATPFIFTVSAAARDFLLREGADMNYGARHLKRAIERRLVQPMSNLIATQQVAAAIGSRWISIRKLAHDVSQTGPGHASLRHCGTGERAGPAGSRRGSRRQRAGN